MLKPTKGDQLNTIKEDFQLINEDIANFDEERIYSMQFKTYKRFIKKKIRQATICSLGAEKVKSQKL